MKKYWLVAKNTWDEMVAYRLNFVMWRLRTILQLLAVYFLWSSLLPSGSMLFGYTQSTMLTYILLTSLFFSIILATRTHDIGETINSGTLSTFLLRPMNFFAYWFWKDVGDKLMNLAFAIGELTILYFILRPPLFLQSDMGFLFLTLIGVVNAILLNFFISILLGLIGFWSSEVWGPRFLFYTTITFFTGTLFPLDILPGSLYSVLRFLPFTYMLFFPIKIYLGQLSQTEIFTGFFISVIWIILSYCLVQTIWKKGIKMYTAYGS